jgi:hypothetical protein
VFAQQQEEQMISTPSLNRKQNQNGSNVSYLWIQHAYWMWRYNVFLINKVVMW